MTWLNPAVNLIGAWMEAPDSTHYEPMSHHDSNEVLGNESDGQTITDSMIRPGNQTWDLKSSVKNRLHMLPFQLSYVLLQGFLQ